MRPEDFSPGNAPGLRAALQQVCTASMRPEDFSPGNTTCDSNTTADWPTPLQ